LMRVLNAVPVSKIVLKMQSHIHPANR
jgi:hypothetical protein